MRTIRKHWGIGFWTTVLIMLIGSMMTCDSGGGGGNGGGGGCNDECTSSGSKQCAGTGYQTCGNYDSDSCLEWSAVTACNTGETCSNGICSSSFSTFSVSSTIWGWQDTGISIATGDVIQISANDYVQVWTGANPPIFETPLGAPDTDVPNNLFVNGLYYRGLIGKIGSSGTPFNIGVGTIFEATQSGNIYMAINESTGGTADNAGSWNVLVTK